LTRGPAAGRPVPDEREKAPEGPLPAREIGPPFGKLPPRGRLPIRRHAEDDTRPFVTHAETPLPCVGGGRTTTNDDAEPYAASDARTHA
jgi:hypothetical protein